MQIPGDYLKYMANGISPITGEIFDHALTGGGVSNAASLVAGALPNAMNAVQKQSGRAGRRNALGVLYNSLAKDRPPAMPESSDMLFDLYTKLQNNLPF